MTEEDIEEYRLLQQAKKTMEAAGTDWVAFPTSYGARKNLSLAKNIIAWYGMSAAPCTETAIEKSGAMLTTKELKECVPRPDNSAGIMIGRPKHDIMLAYLKSWNVSDRKRVRYRQAEILAYIEYGVISAIQAQELLDYEGD